MKIINPGFGQSTFGDAGAQILGLMADGEKLRSSRRENDSYQSVMDIVGKGGVEGALSNPAFQSALIGSGYDPRNFMTINRGVTVTNPNNPLYGEAVTRAGIAAGDSMSSTPMGFKEDQSNAMARHAADLEQQRYEFDNKPLEVMVAGNQNAVGPFQPGKDPTVPAPAYVRQADAFKPGVQPIIKGGQTISMGPNGEVSVTQGGVQNGAVKSEWQSKDAAYGARMNYALTGMDKSLRDGYSTNLQNPGAQEFFAAITKAPGDTPVVSILANVAMDDKTRAYWTSALDALAVKLRKESGAAITATDVAWYGPTYIPMPGDDLATQNKKLQGLAMDRDSYNGALGMPRPDPASYKFTPLGAGSPAQAAPAQTQGGDPVKVNTPEEAMSLPSGTKFITPDGRMKVRP